MFIKPAKSLNGEISIPGDKSISHRSIMFGAIADGVTEVTNFLHGADCLSTISCFRQLGIEIEVTDTNVKIHGKGLNGLSPSKCMLDVGNSGTTARLISGILAGQPFSTTLTGDTSIQKRPMGHPKCRRKRPCAVDYKQQPLTRHPLPHKNCFRTGKILYPACRPVCRRPNKSNGACRIQKPYRTDAAFFRCTN